MLPRMAYLQGDYVTNALRKQSPNNFVSHLKFSLPLFTEVKGSIATIKEVLSFD